MTQLKKLSYANNIICKHNDSDNMNEPDFTMYDTDYKVQTSLNNALLVALDYERTSVSTLLEYGANPNTRN